MAALNDNKRPAARDVESAIEELADVMSRCEDCEDSDELRGHAYTLQSVMRRLGWLAGDWERWADDAEQREEDEEEADDCLTCGGGIFGWLCEKCGE